MYIRYYELERTYLKEKTNCNKGKERSRQGKRKTMYTQNS